MMWELRGMYRMVNGCVALLQEDELQVSELRAPLGSPPEASRQLRGRPSLGNYQLQMLQAGPSALQQPYRKAGSACRVYGQDLQRWRPTPTAHARVVDYSGLPSARVADRHALLASRS